ncbi:YkyA family protein (plasmid) [Rossellomorea sp. AcN35-11]|nr:YkyA family protein [Rossellomorea aquimaris]WJV32309.1 YkyA family protein [Rossellomorea sp. AcN35-11]
MSAFKKVATTSALVVMLTGCNVMGPAPEEEIHKNFENVVKLESNFSKQDESLADLEEREQVIYNKLTEMSIEERDQINSLADDAIAIAEARKLKLEDEKTSILSGEKEFKNVAPLVKKIEEEKIKKAADKTVKAMKERYDVYDEIYDTYLKGIENDIEIYNLLKSDDVELEVFQEKSNKSNEYYQKVTELNKEFNEKTTQFNENKDAFYKAADFKIKEQ